MKIEKNTAVTLRYKLTDANRVPLEQNSEPTVYLHGGYGNTFPRLEEALEGQLPGYQTTLELQPQDAFGRRDEGLVQTIPKSEFPPGVKVGASLQAHDGNGHSRAFTVMKIKGDKVLLDGNHPLAGTALRISATVLQVRPATEIEIAHGHVHGEHGHHH